MTPHYTDPLVTLFLGDCVTVMAELEAESVDSVVCDPPYNLAFMGREWDKNLNHGPWATEAFRVLKPGGYLLAFGGTRTYHRLASAIEDAGFEIRDTLMWIYASGFPKSLDVSKALDKVAGAERPVIRERNWHDPMDTPFRKHYGGDGPEGQPTVNVTGPATDLARKWEGWGTALKPAHEPIVMARKPLVGTVAANVTRYGTGALNIDGTRIPSSAEDAARQLRANTPGAGRYAATDSQVYGGGEGLPSAMRDHDPSAGRWPSNVLLSDAELFDDPNPYVVGSGQTITGQVGMVKTEGGYRFIEGDTEMVQKFDHGTKDSGGYSRFFLIPKADRAERERGLAGGESKWSDGRKVEADYPSQRGATTRANSHPTVKPIDLMRHLVRLVTPPGGVTLDPFLGSGTTALAASEEGFRCIGIEREAEYLEIAVGRLMATPMGLGLDVPIVGRRDIGKQRGNKDAEGRPTLEGPASLGSSWFHGKPDEEDAA